MSLIPYVSIFESGETQVQIRRSYETDDTSKNLKFCYNFLKDFVLINQKRILKDK